MLDRREVVYYFYPNPIKFSKFLQYFESLNMG